MKKRIWKEKKNDGWANPSRCCEVTVFCDCKHLGIFLTSSESGSRPLYSIWDDNRTQLLGSSVAESPSISVTPHGPFLFFSCFIESNFVVCYHL